MNLSLNSVWLVVGCMWLAACGGGGGGGGTSSTVPLNNQGVSVYDYQTPASSKTPVLQAASYPANWDGTTAVTPPKVEPIVSVYPDGTTVTRDGSAEKPFLQSQLTTAKSPITDPNAVVRSVSELTGASTVTGYKGVDYDLRWGTPDPSGPVYAKRYANDTGTWQPKQPLVFWGQSLTGFTGNCSVIVTGVNCVSDTGPDIGQPATEVMDAWKQGWTGNGVNILMEDLLDQQHGAITTLLAYRYAPGASIYGWNISNSALIKDVVDLAGTPVSTVNRKPINLGVVNASYVGTTPNGDYSSVVDRYNNASFQGQVNFTDAVITKAAGNDHIASHNEPVNKALSSNALVNSRLLIVGALDQAGSTDTPVGIASYSNTAGTDASVNSRFLLASGTVPFVNGSLAINGDAVTATSNVGTSYAAPRVAGMVAIVRSKFPNLNASQTASIMLDTARYDTLNCYKTAKGCDKTIYGRGEASLSRALAPVGRLR